MNIDLTPIFQAVIALLAAVITFRLIPWIKAHANDQQRKNLVAAAQIAAYAAEQIYGAGKGEEKLGYAIAILESKGFHLDYGTLREAVEAAVYEINSELVEVDDGVPVLVIEDEEEEDPPKEEPPKEEAKNKTAAKKKAEGR